MMFQLKTFLAAMECILKDDTEMLVLWPNGWAHTCRPYNYYIGNSATLELRRATLRQPSKPAPDAYRGGGAVCFVLNPAGSAVFIDNRSSCSRLWPKMMSLLLEGRLRYSCTTVLVLPVFLSNVPLPAPVPYSTAHPCSMNAF